jgi:hypothetical protein
MRVLCLQQVNNRPLLTASGKSVDIHPRVKQLSVKCSNPLIRYTKECCVFWSEIETFNKKISEMECAIKDIERLMITENNSERYFDMFEHCEGEPHLEECRVYDV